MGLMRNAIPPEYAQTLPEAAETQLVALQSCALDMFIQLDSLKKWRVALVLEEARARNLSSQYGDQHFASLEGLRLTKSFFGRASSILWPKLWLFFMLRIRSIFNRLTRTSRT
ncbi:uncharacterized protein [Spinacia oleracea]|uniref:Uncharacterized protein n=1 Tax=Spinacia oleracea TaxID=3562 RepID=A0ABM3RVM6_SPIOL|nr:uncharacterized protein LOC110783875 [Spinacia oleracea]